MSSAFDKFSFDINHRLVITGVSLFAAGFLAHRFLVSKKKAYVIPSPRTTLLPSLPKEEQLQLHYPPDAFPGARAINTPFGIIRAYEFGPEDGRKVLLVHGISTPCLSLGAVAHGLADNGCRVILFDLFGRGYSDSPGDLQQDVRLFTTQILLVLTSSPLSWTGAGSGKFSMVGYSLGGGISAGFASYFPDMVDSLILIAPSGLIRDHHISRTSRIIYSEGIIPEPILHAVVRRRLQKPLHSPKESGEENTSVGATEAVVAELDTKAKRQAPLSRSHPRINLDEAVNHQVINHQAFPQAFMSSIRYGPIRNQHEDWRRVSEALSRRIGSNNKVLIISGDKDPVIVRDELQNDATEAFNGHVEFRFVDAGHELPITKGDEVVKHIMSFWAS